MRIFLINSSISIIAARKWVEISSQKSEAVHEPELGPLHVCYYCVAWCSWVTTNSGCGGVTDSFACSWTLFLQLACLIQRDMRICVQSYCNILCPVWLAYLGSLLFSEGKLRRGTDLWERGGWWEVEGVEGGETAVRM